MAEKFHIRVEVRIQWRENDKARYPDKIGVIRVGAWRPLLRPGGRHYPIRRAHFTVDQVVKRVPEERFAGLFDDATGRPNAPLRVLVGMLILKEGFGWSDEALFEAVHFNLLVRRALGLLNLTDEVPVESTCYLFKQRLYAYQVETCSDLLKEVFHELTRDQAKRLGVVGEKLRMDGTLLGSNLAACTRLQLIIGCLQEFWKSLTDEPGRLERLDSGFGRVGREGLVLGTKALLLSTSGIHPESHVSSGACAGRGGDRRV